MLQILSIERPPIQVITTGDLPGAIRKEEKDSEDFEMVADPDICIECGFCAGTCPCGIWDLGENNPLT